MDRQIRFSKFRENFVSDPQLTTIQYAMDLHKKFFSEPGKSYSHWFKITFWNKLGRLVQKSRIAILNFFS